LSISVWSFGSAIRRTLPAILAGTDSRSTGEAGEVYPVAFDPTAVVGRRIGAWVIDAAIGVFVFVVLANVFVDGYHDIPGNLCRDPDTPICEEELLGKEGIAVYDETSDTSLFVETDGFAVPLVGFITYGLFTFVLVEGLTGGSIGKLMLGLRVVRDDGQIAGLARSLGRFVGWIVDGIPYCVPLVAPITAYTTKGHRRVGDMIAGTFVVATHHVGHPLSIPGLTPSGTTISASPWVSAPSTGATVGATPIEPAAESSGSGPQWDPERNTYVQWDGARGWLQWDADAEEWVPVR
jgi:uncharacterized RDD family membrane protein YckC